MKKLKLILMAILFVIGQTFALPASAEHNYLTGNRGADLLLHGAIGCGIWLIGPEITSSKGTDCAVGFGIGVAVSAILDEVLFHAAPDSRWSFDGSDGMPKAVYSFSDAAKFSLGAQGKPLDYDGIAVGLKYSF